MKKLILAILSLPLYALAQGTIPTVPIGVISGDAVKLVRANIDLNGIASLRTGTTDPTVVAVNAPKGSLYMRTGASGGGLWIKQDAGSTTNWQRVGVGSGTVTSVAVTVPAIFTTTGSPITGAGTIAISLANETVNTVFAGPASGGSAAPTFRSLVSADIPNNAANTSGNANTATALAANPTDCSSNTFANAIDAQGNLTCSSVNNASTTATAVNTPSTIVLRDGSGNFAAGTITAALSGNATTSTALASNPTDCSSSNYATAIDAQGNLTCALVDLNAGTTSILPVLHGGTGLSSGTSGGILAFTASGILSSSGILTANQLVLGGGAGAVPTSLGSLGTTTTVLHGNAAGAPSFSAVSLTADTSGILLMAKGGTSANLTPVAGGVVWSDSGALGIGAAGTTGQIAHSGGTGAPTWSSVDLTSSTQVSGALPLVNGGTGVAAASANAAFNALSPMTTSGDIIYGGVSGAGTRLPKGSDGQQLTLVSGLPAWQNVASASLSGLTAATATNTIDNLNFAQTWQFSTLTSQNGLTLDLLSTSVLSGSIMRIQQATSNASSTGNLLQLNSSGSGSNIVNLDVENSNNGSSTRGIVVNLSGSSGSKHAIDITNASGSSSAVGLNVNMSATNSPGTTNAILATSPSTNGIALVNITGTGTTGNEIGITTDLATSGSSARTARFSLSSASATGQVLNVAHSGTSGYPADFVGTATGIRDILRLQNSVAAATDSSARLTFAANRTTGGLTDICGVAGDITDIGNASYTGKLIFSCANNGSPQAEIVNFAPANATFSIPISSTGNITGLNLSGTNTGDVTIATFGSSPTANAATLSGQAITLQPADGTHPGAVSTTTQTFGGAKTFSGGIIGALTGNADTSTALAANPTDCGSNTYATTIDASGNLTCAAITNASTTATAANTASTIVLRDGSGNFAAGTITAALSGNATTATNLAANPTDCSANNYATAIDAGGNLTCGLVSLTAGVTGTLPLANGGTNATTAPTARVSLNIDQRSTFSNADYVVLSTDRYVAQVGTMSAPRVVTLPLANSVNAGQTLKIVDESGTVTTTNLLTVTASGSDTIDGAATKVVRSAYGEAYLTSNGSNMWFRAVTGIGAGGTGIGTVPTDGQLLIGSSTTSAYSLGTLTAGNGISITNAGGSITVANSGAETVTTSTKTGNYTILSTDNVIFCDTSGGAFTLTLPTPANGMIFRIIDSTGNFGTNNLTLARHASEKIEGVAASKVYQTSWGAMTVVSNGTDWFVY